MCLAVVAWKVHPRFPLVLAANRDEFYARGAARAGWQAGSPEFWGGRDLEAGGTWLGLDRSGRWALVTNYRDPSERKPGAPSRGQLPLAYLAGGAAPAAFAGELALHASAYAGFNLLAGDRDSLAWYSNRGGPPQSLAPGVYGLSNRLLDTPWPKLLRARRALEASLALDEADAIREALFALLLDPSPAPDDQLPQTGVPLEWERRLSPVFIQSPEYGTRVSTVLIREAEGRMLAEERAHVPAGPPVQTLIHPISAIPPAI
ncbi:MAG: NRDE family protein [Bacteroidia bacterium]|nr:NRDE family protein [Bacteroidia bacterium]